MKWLARDCAQQQSLQRVLQTVTESSKLLFLKKVVILMLLLTDFSLLQTLQRVNVGPLLLDDMPKDFHSGFYLHSLLSFLDGPGPSSM